MSTDQPIPVLPSPYVERTEDVARATQHPILQRLVACRDDKRAGSIAPTRAETDPMIIPCRRILAASGKGGLDTKRWLLRHEGAFVPPRQTSLLDALRP